MSKLLLLIVAAGLVLSSISGVVEIKIHPDRITQIPAALTTATKDKAFIEKGKIQFIVLKRWGEQFVIRDTTKQLELAVVYVKEDAKRLETLLTAYGDNPEYVVPQAELLLTSIKRVRTQAQEASVKVVADLKDESREAFTLADKAYSHMSKLRDEYSAIQKEFAQLTASLEEQIGKLTVTSEEEEAVAGTKDQDDQLQSSEIPLKF